MQANDLVLTHHSRIVAAPSLSTKDGRIWVLPRLPSAIGSDFQLVALAGLPFSRVVTIYLFL